MTSSIYTCLGGLRRAAALPLALGATLACAPDATRSAPDERPPLAGEAESLDGMVVSGSSLATEAGASVLAAGGNAADAAVAAALVLAVTEPSQSGLGGRTQVVFRTGTGEVGGIDATSVVPASYDPASAPEGELGHSAVGVPGTVAGLGRLHGEHGILPWVDVVAPALTLARDGFDLPAGEAARWSDQAAGLVGHPSLARLFLDQDGRALPPGARVLQPALARVLAALAEGGGDAFYRGWIADSIAADMSRNGGYVTRADLRRYQALDAVVARGRYGDLDLVATWLPAGGATSIEALQILAAANISPTDGDDVWGPALAEALARAFADRDSARHLAPAQAVAWITADTLAARHAVTLSERAILRPDSGGEGVRGAREPDHTSHIAVVDRSGFIVALTQSLGPSFGAQVAAPALGFVYASTMGGYLAEGGPGTRAWSSQSPLIAMRRGAPVLSLGGGGGRRIISAVVATVAGVAAGMPLREALTAPRLHPTDGTVLLDGSWDPAVAPALTERGWTVEIRERAYFARLNAISRASAGGWVGVADPVWAGGAASGPAMTGSETPILRR